MENVKVLLINMDDIEVECLHSLTIDEKLKMAEHVLTLKQFEKDLNLSEDFREYSHEDYIFEFVKI